MTITGTLKHVFDTQTVSDKFKKREFILTTEANTPYPQHISFQLNQDKVNLTDNIAIGQEMIVYFNLRGREWNGPQGLKYFNTLEAWKVEAVGAAPVQPSQPSQPAQPTFTAGPEVDDLPF